MACKALKPELRLGAAALAIGMTLSAPALAHDYGDYADTTLQRLITDFPGRYRGTANFEGATAWMEQRLGLGYRTRRQDFTWAGGRASQNVIASAPGDSGKYLVLGAHYDTYFGRPDLQGVDDNASGAGVLTEVARNLAGIRLENGLEIVGFGAEEEGLAGSAAYVAALDAGQRANMIGMINLDSLITGDRLYAHAGIDSTRNPALAGFRDRILRIAQELDIALFTNPGRHPDFPAGTGCCSDGESFLGLGVPVLFLEATNWEIGEQDGYTQTANPAIPNGETWHDPGKDRKDVLEDAFGQDRIRQRLRDFSRLLTRLVLELTNADLLASTASGGAMIGQMAAQLDQQQDAALGLHDRRWLALQDSNRPPGDFGGQIELAGNVGGADFPGATTPDQMGLQILGDYRLDAAWTLGGSLGFQRGSAGLEHGGRIAGKTWQLGLYALFQDDGLGWLAADLTLGRTDFDNRRRLFLRAADGPVLLQQSLHSQTSARTLGARITGGHDFTLGGVRTGPVLGLDYTHYRIDAFHEDPRLRTALDYGRQDYASFEASIGWRLHGRVALTNGMVLHPRLDMEWVRELADGRPRRMTLTSLADGGGRVADLGRPDREFGRARLGAKLSLAKQVEMFGEISARFGHDEGSQPGYALGLQLRF